MIKIGTIKVLGSALYQWELGRKVQIYLAPNMRVASVQFAHMGDAEALNVEPREENGVIVADIPNILLQSGQKIAVFLVDVNESSVETVTHTVIPVIPRPKPSDYVYTETEILNYRTLADRMAEIEKNGVSEEQIASAVEKYLDENPVETGVQFETDETLKLENGVLSVNTTDQMEQDNTLPITSAGVYATVGNIEALLKTI